jgi:hypothetical protein
MTPDEIRSSLYPDFAPSLRLWCDEMEPESASNTGDRSGEPTGE